MRNFDFVIKTKLVIERNTEPQFYEYRFDFLCITAIKKKIYQADFFSIVFLDELVRSLFGITVDIEDSTLWLSILFVNIPIAFKKKNNNSNHKK